MTRHNQNTHAQRLAFNLMAIFGAPALLLGVFFFTTAFARSLAGFPQRGALSSQSGPRAATHGGDGAAFVFSKSKKARCVHV